MRSIPLMLRRRCSPPGVAAATKSLADTPGAPRPWRPVRPPRTDVYSGGARPYPRGGVGGKLVARMADAGARVARGQPLRASIPRMRSSLPTRSGLRRERLRPRQERARAPPGPAAEEVHKRIGLRREAEPVQRRPGEARAGALPGRPLLQPDGLHHARGRCRRRGDLGHGRARSSGRRGAALLQARALRREGCRGECAREPARTLQGGLPGAPPPRCGRIPTASSRATFSAIFGGCAETRTYAVRVAMANPPAEAQLGDHRQCVLLRRTRRTLARRRSRRSRAAATTPLSRSWIRNRARCKLRPVTVGQFREDGVTISRAGPPATSWSRPACTNFARTRS